MVSLYAHWQLIGSSHKPAFRHIHDASCILSYPMMLAVMLHIWLLAACLARHSQFTSDVLWV